MSIQDIEKLISQLQKGQTELARRDREHDEPITILLGQVVTLVPEVREMKATLVEHGELLAQNTSVLNEHTALLLQILAKLDERK